MAVASIEFVLQLALVAVSGRVARGRVASSG
jgi:hypothetical protein